MTPAEINQDLLRSLKEILPILKAVRYQVGLSGSQLERMARAERAIAKAEGIHA